MSEPEVILERYDPQEQLLEMEREELTHYLADGPDFEEVLERWLEDKKYVIELESKVRKLASLCAFARQAIRQGDYLDAHDLLEDGETEWHEILIALEVEDET